MGRCGKEVFPGLTVCLEHATKEALAMLVDMESKRCKRMARLAKREYEKYRKLVRASKRTSELIKTFDVWLQKELADSVTGETDAFDAMVEARERLRKEGK